MSPPDVQPLHPEKRRRLQPYSWGELQGLPKREPLIKGVLDRRGMSVVYGESNCGKTFLTLDMALHIALGWSWRGMRVRQGNVLYVAAEGGLGLTERLRSFWLHHELKEDPSLYLIPAGVDLCMADADTREIVKEAYILDDVQLIVIDTLARAMAGGNENSPDDMGGFVKNCDRIREQTGAHVLIVHHAGKDTAKGSRGHSSLRAAVDTEIEVKKDESGTVTAEIRKQRDGRTGDKFSFKLEAVQLGTDEDGDPISSCILEPTDAPPHKKKPLSGQAKDAYDILLNLMIERGESKIVKNDMAAVKVVPLDLFREALKAGDIADGDRGDTQKKAIQRAVRKLKDQGIIKIWSEWIWIPGQVEK